MNNVQISIQLYGNEAADKREYIYSKVMSNNEALAKIDDILSEIEDGCVFISFEKKEGTLYIRAADIRTMLIKPADMNYATGSRD